MMSKGNEQSLIRKQRLARQLRTNLVRRKEQARKRCEQKTQSNHDIKYGN